MNQDRNISAAFSINSYDLALSSNTGGSVEGAGSYIFNSLISISANPVHGYSFSSWSGDGVTNPLSQNTSVTMNQDRNISALFNRILLKSILITENQENNWYKSNWFGIFYQSETGWCYHTELGWLFPDTIQNDSFWAWSPKLEWMWINSSTYTNSFAWMAKETNWIYFDFQNDFDNKIYSYQNGSWTNYSRD